MRAKLKGTEWDDDPRIAVLADSYLALDVSLKNLANQVKRLDESLRLLSNLVLAMAEEMKMEVSNGTGTES